MHLIVVPSDKLTTYQGYHKVTKGVGTPSKQLSENTALVGMQYSELLHKCVGISRAEGILHKSAMPPLLALPLM